MPFGLALVQFVTFDPLLEVLYLGDNIATMVSNLNETSKEPVAEVLVLNPPREVLTLQYNFLKFFQRDY